MRKGGEIVARVYVEGEAEPTADFAEIGVEVVKQALLQGAQGLPAYSFTVRDLTADDDRPDPPDESP